MILSIPFLMVPNVPTTMGTISVSIFHILCISISRSLQLLFFSISLLDTIIFVVVITSIRYLVNHCVELVCHNTIVWLSEWNRASGYPPCRNKTT